MRFDGSFDPPAVGKLRTPIEVSGPGSCEVAEDGLRVQGRRSKSVGWQYWLIFGAFVIGVFAVRVVMSPPDWAFRIVVAVGLVLLVLAMSRVGHVRKLGAPVDWVIPWPSVGSAARAEEESETVLLTVRRFDPSGGLYFTPSAGADAFLRALEERRPE